MPTLKSYERFLKYAQENPNVYDENGNFIDWRKEFSLKEE